MGLDDRNRMEEQKTKRVSHLERLSPATTKQPIHRLSIESRLDTAPRAAEFDLTFVNNGPAGDAILGVVLPLHKVITGVERHRGLRRKFCAVIGP